MAKGGAAPVAAAASPASPWYSKENLLAARTPIGFVMHYGAMYLMEYFPLVLQLPSIGIIWWEVRCSTFRSRACH